jgi:Tfp pilus assembly protein PilV
MKNLNQAGDTIIEVLLSLTVLATVIGGAYATSNRAIIQSRSAQEHLQATKLAEGQLERLKSYAADNAVGDVTDQCFDESAALKPKDNSSCKYNDLFNYYFNSYTNDADNKTATVRVRVEWDSETTATQNNVELWYRVYYK